MSRLNFDSMSALLGSKVAVFDSAENSVQLSVVSVEKCEDSSRVYRHVLVPGYNLTPCAHTVSKKETQTGTGTLASYPRILS